MLKELTVREGREIALTYPVVSHGPLCLHKAARRRATYVCTRSPEHDGPHVSHIPDGTAVVMWDSNVNG